MESVSGKNDIIRQWKTKFLGLSMILKHRDKELLRFEWIEPQGVRIVSVSEQKRILRIEEYGEKADDIFKVSDKIGVWMK